MNLLLLNNKQIAGNRATVSGRQLQHLLTVNNLGVGDSLRIGEINGLMGKGVITEIDNHSASLEFELDRQPPSAVPLTLVLALPRPKMLRRILQTVASMGVKRICLIHSTRVEKSFWQTAFLSPEAVQEQLLLGLEQSMDTQLPTVSQHRLFKPFVEDQLPDVINSSRAIVAHPSAPLSCPIDIQEPTTLVIGPEGGFIPYEIEKLAEQGVQSVSIGSRILRVETAVPTLISRLFPA